tara:strand:- start:50 stop:358 length:309 start_codon:yes stop_codon:yes gene_type:complete
MKDNKLIAEFMGLSIKEGVCYYTDADDMFPMGIEVEEPHLPYDTSWDWLMPVVEKCLEMHNNLIDGRDVIDTSYPSIAQALQVVSLKETYKAVVEFINQINK